MVLLRCTLHWTGILGGNGRRCAIDVDVDFIVLFMITIALSFIGNVLLGIAIWRSRTPSKVGWCYLVSVGSYVLCGRYIVGVLIYRQQSANAAHRFFVDGNKWGVDTLDHFPSTSPDTTDTISVVLVVVRVRVRKRVRVTPL
jgi:hypothetical protein